MKLRVFSSSKISVTSWSWMPLSESYFFYSIVSVSLNVDSVCARIFWWVSSASAICFLYFNSTLDIFFLNSRRASPILFSQSSSFFFKILSTYLFSTPVSSACFLIYFSSFFNCFWSLMTVDFLALASISTSTLLPCLMSALTAVLVSSYGDLLSFWLWWCLWWCSCLCFDFCWWRSLSFLAFLISFFMCSFSALVSWAGASSSDDSSSDEELIDTDESAIATYLVWTFYSILLLALAALTSLTRAWIFFGGCFNSSSVSDESSYSDLSALSFCAWWCWWCSGSLWASLWDSTLDATYFYFTGVALVLFGWSKRFLATFSTCFSCAFSY